MPDVHFEMNLKRTSLTCHFSSLMCFCDQLGFGDQIHLSQGGSGCCGVWPHVASQSCSLNWKRLEVTSNFPSVSNDINLSYHKNNIIQVCKIVWKGETCTHGPVLKIPYNSAVKTCSFHCFPTNDSFHLTPLLLLLISKSFCPLIKPLDVFKTSWVSRGRFPSDGNETGWRIRCLMIRHHHSSSLWTR